MPRAKKYIDCDPRDCLQEYLTDHKFTVKEVASILRIQPSTLLKKRIRKTGPKYIKTGSRSILYPAKDLAEYMKAHHYFSTSEDHTLLPRQKPKEGG